MKIMQEVTEWAVDYRQPNHVYLMSGDKALAYVPWGKGKPVYFKNFQRINRRGRKFVEVKKNPWKFDLSIRLEEESTPKGQTWRVPGSKGGEYVVSFDAGQWSCSCSGYSFRRTCRHISELSR